MSTIRNRHSVVVALVMALAVTPVLSGCFGNPIESMIEGATGGEVDLGGASVPEGFPAEVPLIDGEIVNGMSLGAEGATIYNVVVKVDGLEAAETIKGQLEAAGFTSAEGLGATGEAGATLMYANANWGVLVVVAGDASAGFAATYTVTEGAPAQ